MYLLRFAMRARETTEPAARSALYRTAVEMTAWCEGRGCLMAVASEHHGSEDGYLPSPIPMAAAMAAATSTLPINVSALLVAMYEPVKLAEDLAVVDLLSGGRVSYVVGIGYVEREFEMFGVDRRRRAALTEERIGWLRRAWTGEPCEIDGRTVSVRPRPLQPGGPMLAYGGSTEAAARRAGRLGMFFSAQVDRPELEAAYRDEAARAGVAPVGCSFPPKDMPMTVFVADDPDRAWAELGPYLLVDAVGYARWNPGRSDVAAVSQAATVDELRAEEGQYRIVTPAQAAAMIGAGLPLALQPLVGGVPPELAWPYLERAVEVANEAGGGPGPA